MTPIQPITATQPITAISRIKAGAPYNNQPITAISSLKAGAAQPYLQRAQTIESDNGGDFLKILYDALKSPATTAKAENQPFNTILSKEVQNIMQQGASDQVHVADSNTQATKNFFSTIGETYYNLVSNNDDALAANLASLLADKKDTNSLFNTASDMRRAIRSYEKSSMLSPTNAENSFFA